MLADRNELIETALRYLIQQRGRCSHRCGICWYWNLPKRLCGLLFADLTQSTASNIVPAHKDFNGIWGHRDKVIEDIYEWAVKEFLKTHPITDIVEILL
jgi:hypothetical protein